MRAKQHRLVFLSYLCVLQFRSVCISIEHCQPFYARLVEEASTEMSLYHKFTIYAFHFRKNEASKIEGKTIQKVNCVVCAVFFPLLSCRKTVFF